MLWGGSAWTGAALLGPTVCEAHCQVSALPTAGCRSQWAHSSELMLASARASGLSLSRPERGHLSL